MKNMKYIKFIIAICVLIFISCSRKDVSDMFPDYKLINNFSKKINKQNGLVLSSYGVNSDLPKTYKVKNGTANFIVSYSLPKKRYDFVSLKEARSLLISVAESFLKEINSSEEVRPYLDFYPCTNDLIDITLYFRDENSIQLGQGISSVFFAHGKIEYERYDIREYRSTYPSIGKNFTVHEETYAEALDIVRQQGTLVDL